MEVNSLYPTYDLDPFSFNGCSKLVLNAIRWTLRHGQDLK